MFFNRTLMWVESILLGQRYDQSVELLLLLLDVVSQHETENEKGGTLVTVATGLSANSLKPALNLRHKINFYMPVADTNEIIFLR
jgi:hypothetical protein